MAEINNNIPSFGYKKINNNIEKPAQVEKGVMPEDEIKKGNSAYTPAAETIGRSQVRPANGANIAKTVEETIELATNNPALMGCCEGIFCSKYNDYIQSGMNESDAYMKALMAEEELLGIYPRN
jgi:hypothetical protein